MILLPKDRLATISFFGGGAYSLATLFYGIAFALLTDLVWKFSLIILAGALLSFCSPAPLSLTQELVPPSARALSGTSSVMTIHLLGSIPGPFIAGLVSDAFGISTALTVVSVISGLLAIIFRMDRMKLIFHSGQRMRWINIISWDWSILAMGYMQVRQHNREQWEQV